MPTFIGFIQQKFAKTAKTSPSRKMDRAVGVALLRPLRELGVLLLVSASLLSGCGENAKPATASPTRLAPADTRFALAVGEKPIRARVQLTELELASGLMRTTSLPDGEGMIFVYRDAATRAFWMANVPYDIDLGYFDAAGRLDEVVLLRANDTTPVSSKSASIRYALEAPAGWFAAQGLKPGAKLDLPALARAVEARGFKPGNFVTETQ